MIDVECNIAFHLPFLYFCNREFQQEKNLTNVQKHSASNFNRRTGRFEVGSVRFKKHRPNDLKTEIDAHGRPIQKIAVLCGPPGKALAI